MFINMKCKKCRKLLFNDNECCKLFINAHSADDQVTEFNCISLNDMKLIFLNEEFLPEWIKCEIEKNNWSKGKLNCLYCNVRIGSFDFISGLKCECNNFVLPPVHIIKSKIDLIK